MFTGLVEEVAKVRGIVKNAHGARICVEAGFCEQMKIGDSIALNGACQTVVSLDNGVFEVEAMNETLRLTNLEGAKYVNIERAMRADSRFDGHFVSGHIDGMARFINMRSDGFSKVLRFEYVTEQMILKGSVCVNGVSLTISALDKDYFEVSLIPHTLENTNLGCLQAGDSVNIETDMLAKYIEKMCQSKESNIDENFLKMHGFS